MILAPLERLPVELLQPIFVNSMCNIALLQSSPYIGARLSSYYIYNATADYYLRNRRSGGDCQTRWAAQTYIFASKWMTWPFFQSWILRAFGKCSCLCAAESPDSCTDAQWPPNFADATTMVFSRSHLPRIAYVKGRLPKKLLHGPWTEPKVQFLRFLLWTTSMTINWSDRDSALNALQGRQDAMREGYLPAVELFNHNRRLGRGADVSTIRFAVIKAGCDRSIVYDTMLAADSWGGIRGSCDALEEWCDRRIAAGDPKGEWVRLKLQEIRFYNVNDCKDRKLTPSTGDYDGGAEDKLVVNELKWNEKYFCFGWFFRPGPQFDKEGIHGVTRSMLGDFWKHLHGGYHAILGWDPQPFSIDMWNPQVKASN